MPHWDQILLVDVDAPYAEAFDRWETERDASIIRVSGELPVANGQRFSLCVATLRGDDPEAFARVRSLRKGLRGCPIVILAHAVSTDTVVRLMRLGVADVIGLPAPPDDVAARATVHAIRADAPAGSERIVGQSVAIQGLRRELAAAAPMRSTVLITGETGTGKGLLARTLHDLSDRRDRPFVHVDCASLSPTVIESELFGHERGAFTGAFARHAGRFELAEDGTIFLDEIGDLEPHLQAKLLRVLQDREYERVGGGRTHIMTARVVAATSRDLRHAVDQGRFRADLFFRLNVFHLRMPALRERLGDIPLLVRAGLERLAARLELTLPRVSAGFYERLMQHAWPGNVRELLNVLERVLVQHRADALDEAALDGWFVTSVDSPIGFGAGETELPRDERDAVAAVLIAAGGNVSRAARRLGVPRSTLRYRIRQLGLKELIPSD